MLPQLGPVLCNEGHGTSRRECNCKLMLYSRCSRQRWQRQQRQLAGCFRAMLAAQNRAFQKDWEPPCSPSYFYWRSQNKSYVPLYTGPGLQVGFSPALSTSQLLSKNNSSQRVTIIKQPAYALSTILYLHHTAKRKNCCGRRIISPHSFAALPSTPRRRHRASLEIAILMWKAVMPTVA